MPLPARLLVAALAGLAAALSFEPVRLVYLLPVALAGFVLCCRGLSLRAGFVTGTVFGTAFMLTLLPWLRVIGSDAWVMLSVFEGLYYGLLGLGVVAVARLRAWPVWAATLWVGLEGLRGAFPLGGFPWGRLAFATVDTPVAPLYGYLGSAGVTFVVALVATALAWAALAVRRAPARALGAVAGACALASSAALLPAGEPAASEGSVRVAVVQGDVPGEGMDAFAERRAVLDNHVAATRRLAEDVRAGARAPDLVVWPESSTDIDPFEDPSAFADISGAVDAVGAPTLVGAMVSGPEPDEVLNQGIVWRSGTGPGERYSKIHPVPFGEYIPFRDLLAGYFTRLDQIPRDMRAGTEPGVLEMGGVTLGDVICFEVAYDSLVRDVVSRGAEVVVVQTNNATYMGTGQVEQQFAISRLRAIETGRSVVVAATNGISGLVAPSGEVVARAPVRSSQVLVRSVDLHRQITWAVRWGGWLELLGALVALVAVAGGVILRRRDHGRDGRGLRAQAPASVRARKYAKA